MKNGMLQCKVCGAQVTDDSPSVRTVSKAYDRHHSNQASRFRGFSILLVAIDCVLIGLQPILVYMSKVDGKFPFSPISVNFLTELTKVFFAICMLIFQAQRQHRGEKSLLSPTMILQAAKANYLLALPAFLYAINNYLKFIMQLYFNPATVKMLSNLKWEALGLLLIGISVNQLHTTPSGATIVVPLASAAYLYTLIFVTVPSLASVFNEYALKSQFETSVHLQNLFLYGYGALFNLLAIIIKTVFEGGAEFNLFEGHSRATAFLIVNNAAQGILSCFFLKYADAILKKYSSTVATIFTGLASAALFGHKLTINFVLGVSIVIISMHQFFSSLSKPKDGQHDDNVVLPDNHMTMNGRANKGSLVDMAAGATEEANHKIGVSTERQPLLPI
ncbi:hypothetical protein O6H91_04G138000 [Diphasiastrum complanatum]|uniref:Uncharacterized protein n=1 Tax=Diphasiastrum complanatum TaxID=34168 RepID=A0ACC2E2D8_DIPCM|nr:hypothetical protein O6H91_04G138000 [Diphasiastrum complanatum]